MINKVSLSLVLSVLPLSSAPAAEPLPDLAVLDMQLKGGVDPNVGDMLGEMILARLNKTGRFGSILGGADIRDMLSLEEQRSALGCEDDSCLTDLGGALGVPYLFTSSLGTFGGRYILTLKLASVDDAKVLSRASEVIEGEGSLLEALPGLVERMVHEGLGGRAKEGPNPSESAIPPETAPVTTRRPLLKRTSFRLGAATISAAMIVGVALNDPSKSLAEDGQLYRMGSLTWDQFSGVVVRRRRLNLLGVSLGSVGAALTAYAWRWGS